MSDDKQLLDRLVELARTKTMTAAEMQQQRRSWLRGELGIEHPDWTDDEIGKLVDNIAPLPLPAAIDLAEGVQLERQGHPQYGSAPAQLSKAAVDVIAERIRQITGEGWSPEHDDEHRDGSMARAAAAYAYMGSIDYPQERRDLIKTVTHGSWHGLRSVLAMMWPWERKWFKAGNSPRRDLVKAGALIIAEIERRDRHQEQAEAEAWRDHQNRRRDERAYRPRFGGAQ